MPSFNPEQLMAQQARLRRLAAAIVGESLADDVVQETWLAALALERRGPDRWRAWLTTVAHNLAWKRRLTDDRRQAREALAAREEALVASDELIAQIEEGHVVERALTELDEPYRSTLLWRFYEELSIAEISRRSGLPESTTRTHLQRGLERLRERLQSERGPEWRAALLPLLKQKPNSAVPTSAASLTSLGALMFSTLTKPLLISAFLLAGWALWSDGDVETSVVPASADLAVDAVVEKSEVQTSPSKRAALADTSRVEIPVSDDAGAESLAAKGTADDLSLRVIDPRSGLGVAHVYLTVQRGDQRIWTQADSTGLARVPLALTDQERRDPLRDVRVDAQVRAGSTTRSYPVPCTLVPSRESIDFEARLESAWAFRVRIPEGLDESTLDSLVAGAVFTFGTRGSLADAKRYRAVHRDGRDLCLLLPREAPHEPDQPIVTEFMLVLTSLDGEHQYRVQLPATTNLGDEPRLAEPVLLSTQTLRVVEATSGQAIAGVFVSIRQLGLPNSKPFEWANGTTDEEGRVRLASVPLGPQQVLYHKKGYDFTMGEIEVLSDPPELELGLKALAGISDLTVTVRVRGGPIPENVHVNAFPVANLAGMFGSRSVPTEPQDGGGWRGVAVLESLLPGRYRVEVSTVVPGLGTKEPVLVDVPSDPIQIDLEEPPPTRSLYVRLPDEIRSVDFWIADERRNTLLQVAYGSRDRGRVTRVAERGSSRTWMLYAEGYVPVVGDREDWEKAEAVGRDESIFELRPQFELGWGVLVQAYGAQGVIPAVTITDPDTGLVLGRTDQNGRALIRADIPLERMALSDSSGRNIEVPLRDGPLQHVFLR